MKKQDLYNAMGSVGEDLIAKNAMPRVRKQKTIKWKPLVAACLALLLIGGSVGGYAIAVEAAEYREAVAFFEDHQLSTEGLTREEIKAVYRDITMKTFSYEKTAEVLNTLSVELYSADLGKLDKEGLADFWENRKTYRDYQASDGIWYDVGYRYFEDVGEILDTVACYKGEELLWEHVADKSFTFAGYAQMANGVLIYGLTGFVNSATEPGYGQVYLLDKNGQLVWEETSTYEGSQFTAAAVTENEIALFGTIDFRDQRYTLFTLMNHKGRILELKKTAESGYLPRYKQAAKLSDGYLTLCGNSKLVIFSSEGVPIETKSYLDCDGEYAVTNMLYYEGKIWLSAFKKPNYKTETLTALMARVREIEREYWKGWEGEDTPFDSVLQEEYTDAFRTIFEATLLVCDEDLTATKAYSLSGARVTQELEFKADSNGNISWHVMRLDNATPPSLVINVSCIYAVVTEFDLTFDKNGRLIDKTEIETYSRQILY